MCALWVKIFVEISWYAVVLNPVHFEEKLWKQMACSNELLKTL